MFVPAALIILALGSAAALAYGTHPDWAQYPHGIDVILWCRSLQWLLAGLALVFALGLVGLVIAGKRRIWWLAALVPVLALFGHRFATDPLNGFAILDSPSFVSAQDAGFLRDDDYVVGLQFGDAWYAYPYAALYRTPVVIQSDHERRLMLMWSAFANRAVAMTIDQSLRARDLDIVSMPANALLLYNSRLGQFINALKGQTIDDRKPAGFRSPLPTTKLTWKQWRTAHPLTRVMLPAGGFTAEPSQPLKPRYAMPRPTTAPSAADLPPETPVTLIATTRPVAVPDDAMRPTSPAVNVPPGDLPVLLFRDPVRGAVLAFDRRIDDLSPRFVPVMDLEQPDVAFVDLDTHTQWTAAGVAVQSPDPQFKGRRLARVTNVEDGLYWDVMKFWYPQLQLHRPAPLPIAHLSDVLADASRQAAATKPAPKPKPPAHHRRLTPRRR